MHPTSIRLALALALGLPALPAQATFHLMKVVEVFAGTPASPRAQYVVIQMYAPGQNLVNGHAVTVFNGAGQQVGSFPFTRNVANGANQAKILIATPEAASFFNVTPDLTISAALLSGGGKVCFADTIDCVAWGAYTGGSAGVGPPFNPQGGITPSRAILRRLDIAGTATTLDAGDDTDNSANDFRFGSPAPRNNAGMLGRAPANTCGNGVIEGLEQCDDHNVANGDGCSSVCAVEQGASTRRVAADYNGDGRSDLLWRNGSTGANVIWRSANSASSQAVQALGAQWQVAGVGDVNRDGAADVVWRNGSTGTNTVWLSANAATARAMTGVGSGDWRIVAMADFDGSGTADVFWRNVATGANVVWKAANSSTVLPVTAIGPDWLLVGTGDFNRDGRADVLWRNLRTGSNAIWRSASSATPQGVTGVGSASWKVVGVGDFDGDGASDILWRSVANGSDVIWRSANAATQQAVAAITDLNWKAQAVADYDGDGKSDIFWRNTATGSNMIWRSANTATRLAVTGVGNAAWSVVPYQGQPLGSAAPSAGASVSVADASIGEGDSGSRAATFFVRLSQPLGTAVRYDIATADGSADAGSDYQAAALAGQSIPAGQTSGTFAVQVYGDRFGEPTETFSVHLANVAGATVADGIATGSILDDDEYEY